MKLAGSHINVAGVGSPAWAREQQTRRIAQMCRDLLSHQKAPIARKLRRLVDGAERSAIEAAGDRFGRLDQLKQAANFVAVARPGHAPSRQLRNLVECWNAAEFSVPARRSALN